MEVVPFSCVEFIEFFDQVLLFESLISKILSDVSPVFVFDMCIIIFVIGLALVNCTGCFLYEEFLNLTLYPQIFTICYKP